MTPRSPRSEAEQELQAMASEEAYLRHRSEVLEVELAALAERVNDLRDRAAALVAPPPGRRQGLAHAGFAARARSRPGAWRVPERA